MVCAWRSDDEMMGVLPRGFSLERFFESGNSLPDSEASAQLAPMFVVCDRWGRFWFRFVLNRR